MTLSSGSRLGTYEVLSLLGLGGMGEVYRARDQKLGREVALKILPAALGTDSDRLARFEREARALAALNHPNIATIHGVEEGGETRALVMELISGETLTERLARAQRRSTGGGAGTALPLHEALSIARQIADALDAAHTQGIVHRDLKPDNVKITPTGTVKVLDFGIAKFHDPHTTGDRTAATVVGETQIGAVLGTAAYMSPEQARGLPVDKRTDVWAFGCVLYELLTGKSAFDGATATDTLAAVLEREPDWQCLPAALPVTVRRLLQRCLQKDTHRRLRDLGDIRIQLEDALAAPEHAEAGAPQTRGRGQPRTRAAFATAAVALIAVAGFVAFRYFERTPEPPVAPLTRLSISTPWPVIPPAGTAISPDGRQVAFVAADASGQNRLVLRALDSVETRALPGTEGAFGPFWSPDGRSLGFHADGEIKRVDVAGGSVLSVVQATITTGSWSNDDVILHHRETGLWTVPAGGGALVQVTTLDQAHDYRHAWAQFLPDRRHFLYFVGSFDEERRGVYVGSIDSRDTKLVLKTDFQARYAPPGYLLFISNEQLLAQPFDLERHELTGRPTIVADGIWVAALAGRATFSVSDNGTLAYVNASLWNTQLAWFDRRGALLGELGPPDRYAGHLPNLSPDGGRVAIARGLWSREQVWVLDADDGAATRLTFEDQRAVNPVWSSDGRRVVYDWWTGNGRQLVIKDVDSGEQETMDLQVWPFDWSADGRFIVYQQGSLTEADLWALPLEGERTPIALTQTPRVYEYQAQLSPDDRWLAYVSNESGRDEVYVQRFPDGGGKRQVSAAGGVAPRWRPDGTELYYLAPDGDLTAVAVRGTTPLELGSPSPLFRSRAPYLDASNRSVGGVLDVTADGQRFLINARPNDLTAPIMVVGNWTAALQ